MADSSRFSDSTDASSGRRKAPNFSRPHPQSSSQPKSILKRERVDPDTVHTISAFHEPNRELPSEPRFSLDSERTYNTASENSAGSDFAWDGQSGELVSKQRPQAFDEQRYAPSSSRRPNSASTKSSGGKTAKPPVQLAPPKDDGSSSSKKSNIMKRISVDQRSERVSTSRDQFEDTASHHTVSEDGDSASFDSEGQWSTSDHPTFGLTDAQIRKLQRKGINPSLYAEMREAKKGKKWVGPLLGNGFLS